MKVRFWGTRGSIAKPGPTTVRYGGNTSCVQVTTDGGTLLVFDCGTGAHALGAHLMATSTGKIRGHLLLGHTHWDHIQGIPFFAPLFVPGNEWDIYAPAGLGAHLRDILAGQMEYTYFPVSLDQLGATIRFHELREESFIIDDVKISTLNMNHPALTLGYRVEADGCSLVYATDHEPHGHEAATSCMTEVCEVHPGDQRHGAFIQGADLLIHDAQYTAAEYPQKVGWGHSTLEYVVDMAIGAKVGRLALFHHDPMRTDEAVDALVAQATERVSGAGASLGVFGAAEGLEIALLPSPGTASARLENDASAVSGLTAGELHPSTEVLVRVDDPAIQRMIMEAALQSGLQPVDLAHPTRQSQATERTPLLAIASPNHFPLSREVPNVVILPQHEESHWLRQSLRANLLDVVTWPCSHQYLRSRLEAWRLRQIPRWSRASAPPDEDRRLEHVRALGLLDTPPEERFERHMRLARRAFDCPVAIISLIDSDRQWLKTPSPLLDSECPRDVSVCAHTILRNGPLVIEDLTSDALFADSVVARERHLRFYAGIPLRDGEGVAVGTLCLMDLNPRTFSDGDRSLLADMARMVERELARGPLEETGSGEPYSRPSTALGAQ